MPDYTLDDEEELEGALEVLLLPFISFISFIELICIVFAISYDFIHSNDPVMVISYYKSLIHTNQVFKYIHRTSSVNYKNNNCNYNVIQSKIFFE